MKRPKRAIPTVEKFEQSRYSVRCPHCKTGLTGGIGKTIDRLFCFHCGEIIILDREAQKDGKTDKIDKNKVRHAVRKTSCF